MNPQVVTIDTLLIWVQCEIDELTEKLLSKQKMDTQIRERIKALEWLKTKIINLQKRS